MQSQTASDRALRITFFIGKRTEKWDSPFYCKNEIEKKPRAWSHLSHNACTKSVT